MNQSLKLTALEPETLVSLLKRCGGKHFTPELLQKDIDSGAPVNSDGTVNFLEYIAWIIMEMNDADESE